MRKEPGDWHVLWQGGESGAPWVICFVFDKFVVDADKGDVLTVRFGMRDEGTYWWNELGGGWYGVDPSYKYPGPYDHAHPNTWRLVLCPYSSTEARPPKNDWGWYRYSAPKVPDYFASEPCGAVVLIVGALTLVHRRRRT